MEHKRRSRLNRQKEKEREIESPLWKRRKFLAASAVTVGALATGTWFGVKEMLKKSEAEEFFENFPLTMPGVAKVEKFPVKDSEHCLVHIRLVHEITLMDEFAKLSKNQELLKKIRPEIRKALEALTTLIAKQGELKALQYAQDLKIVLEHLSTNHAFDEVYVEGWRIEEEGRLAELSTVLRTGEEIMENMQREIAQERDPEQAKKMQQTLHDIQSSRNELLKKFPAVDLALFEFAQNKQLRIRAAESAQAHGAAMAQLRNELLLTDEKVQNDREDALLQIISNNGSVIAVTIYGGAHDWTDNINKWNQTNKDKFNYIRITPVAYQRHTEEKSEADKRVDRLFDALRNAIESKTSSYESSQ